MVCKKVYFKRSNAKPHELACMDSVALSLEANFLNVQEYGGPNAMELKIKYN